MSRDAEQEEEGEGIHVGGSDDVRGGEVWGPDMIFVNKLSCLVGTNHRGGNLSQILSDRPGG